MTMAAERARIRLEALAGVGLDLPTFATAAVEVLRQALPFSAACLAPADPATELVTGTVKAGGLTDEHDEEWAYWEYESAEAWNFRSVVHRPGCVTSTDVETGGRPEASERHTNFFVRHFGFSDEMRSALRADGVTWGFCALFREGVGSTFTPAEQAFMSSVAPIFARGFRTGLVAGAAAGITSSPGPAVLVVDPTGQVRQASVGAASAVAELGGGPLGSAALPLSLLNLVGAARSYAAGRVADVPRMRLRAASGGWLVASASPLMSVDGGRADVVLSIEEARPPEVIPLVVAAFGLTAREQAVVQLVLQGVSTAEIAATLHLSAYTVQDHLKSVFEKAGVRSRRELTARVFYDQYAPRLAQQAKPGPSGWFSSTTTAAASPALSGAAS